MYTLRKGSLLVKLYKKIWVLELRIGAMKYSKILYFQSFIWIHFDPLTFVSIIFIFYWRMAELYIMHLTPSPSSQNIVIYLIIIMQAKNASLLHISWWVHIFVCWNGIAAVIESIDKKKKRSTSTSFQDDSIIHHVFLCGEVKCKAFHMEFSIKGKLKSKAGCILKHSN